MVEAAVVRAFSQAARRYDSHAEVQLACARSLLGMLPPLPQCQRAMDLGCGTLPLARPLREQVQCEWWAVDASVGMLAEARERGRLDGFMPLQADAEALPFAAGMFDLVFSSFALQWASSPANVLAEVARVLAPGGLLALSLPVAGTLRELADSWARVDGGVHVNALPALGDWQAAAAEAGLTAVADNALSLTAWFPDVRTLARSLKDTGANVVPGRQAGLVTPARFRAMETEYERWRTNQGVPLSWQAGFLLLEKR